MQFVQPTWKLEGLTCSFARPEAVKATWAFEALKLVREFQIHRQDLEAQVSQPALMKLTRKRLNHLIAQVSEQCLSLESLLQPLGWKAIYEKHFMSYLNESPGPSRLAANYDNLFRDWIWGAAENKAGLDLIRAAATQGTAGKNVLVMGAGGCRLAYDLHIAMTPKRTVVSDYNPLLLLAAQKIIRGGSLDLIEFPLMPMNGEVSAIKQRLHAPQAIVSDEDFQFVLADARQNTFAPGSFDTVVTPWLIDVVDVSLPEFLSRLNAILPAGGTWINFGPLGFNNAVLASHYTLEEVKYLVEKSGFEMRGEKYEMIPYMHNPSSNSHRMERVLVFEAVKIRDTGPVAVEESEFPWQADPQAPLKLPVDTMNLAQGHLFNAEIMVLLRSEKSFDEIVAHVMQKYQIPAEQAAHLISEILHNVTAVLHRNPLCRNVPT